MLKIEFFESMSAFLNLFCLHPHTNLEKFYRNLKNPTWSSGGLEELERIFGKYRRVIKRFI